MTTIERATISPIAEQIAAAFGEGWSWQPCHDQNGGLLQDSAILHGPDSVMVRASLRHWHRECANRIYLSGVLPEHLRGHRPARTRGLARTITISLDKSPQRIAAECSRRLLRDWDTVLAATAEQAAEDGRLVATRDGLVDELVEVLDAQSWNGPDDSRVVHHVGHADGVAATIRVPLRQDRWEARVDMRIPAQWLPELAEWLAAHH